MHNQIPSFAIASCLLASSAAAQTWDSSKLPKPPHANGPAATLVGGSGSNLLPGGSDDPASAVSANAITGSGTFAVDSTLATTGTPVASCGGMGTDVWFYWTAAASGISTINLCGSADDTVLAVWSSVGGAPLAQLLCNDDACNFASSVSINAVAGQSYFVEVGSYGGGAGYLATLNITAPTPPPVNDECGGAIALTGAGPFPFDNTNATTGVVGQSEAACLFFGLTAIGNDLWYTWTATRTGEVRLSLCEGITLGNNDTKAAVYAGAGCPAGAAIACNDDASCTASGLRSTVLFQAVCGQSYTFQLGRYNGASASYGTFSVTENGAACGTGTAYCFGSNAACPCGNGGGATGGCANSVNPGGASLTATGTASVGADTVVLAASGMPNSFALFFRGDAQVATAFGDGLRCAGGNVLRLGTNVVAGGNASRTGIAAAGSASAGATLNYQVWYRNADPVYCTASTFNLSNGYSITWAP